MSHRELYERLGVEPSASEAEIRRAYLSLARKLHPDRGAGPEAEATLARIGEAWAVLKNRRLRKVYDEERWVYDAARATLSDAPKRTGARTARTGPSRGGAPASSFEADC